MKAKIFLILLGFVALSAEAANMRGMKFVNTFTTPLAQVRPQTERAVPVYSQRYFNVPYNCYPSRRSNPYSGGGHYSGHYVSYTEQGTVNPPRTYRPTNTYNSSPPCGGGYSPPTYSTPYLPPATVSTPYEPPTVGSTPYAPPTTTTTGSNPYIPPTTTTTGGNPYIPPTTPGTNTPYGQPPSYTPSTPIGGNPSGGGSSGTTPTPINPGKGSKGNNGVGNGVDPQPPGNPPVNDGPGTGPGNPGNKGGKGNKQLLRTPAYIYWMNDGSRLDVENTLVSGDDIVVKTMDGRMQLITKAQIKTIRDSDGDVCTLP
ncbi:MAG TPA: hypothetical protein VGP72_14225 [Planctomycetota bacterium]|jgi:hypothetical protein